jgi:hypothetical protein
MVRFSSKAEDRWSTLVSIQNILLIAEIANNDLDVLGLELFIDELLFIAACCRRRSQNSDAIKL